MEISDPIREVVVYYNVPSLYTSQIFLPLTTIHVANQIATRLNAKPELNGFYPECRDEDYINALCIKDKVEQWSFWGSWMRDRGWT